MTLPTNLNLASATKIKSLIWGGTLSQEDIAQQFQVTQTTISRISTGRQYFDAPWPDGTVGPLSIAKRTEIRLQRYPSLGQRPISSSIQNQIASALAKVINDDLIQEVENDLNSVLQPPPKASIKTK